MVTRDGLAAMAAAVHAPLLNGNLGLIVVPLILLLPHWPTTKYLESFSERPGFFVISFFGPVV